MKGYIYYDYAESTGKNKQIWKVLKDPSKGDSSISFESVHWPDYYLTYDGSGSNPADPEVLCTNCYHHFDQSGSGCGFPPEWIRGKHQTWWEASIFGS